MKILFVLGTSTDVGKTYITSQLVKALKQCGKKVFAIKPVISGYDDENESDISILANAIGGVDKNDIALYKLKEPLSPDIAAKIENIEIDIEKIFDFCVEKINQQYDLGCEYFFIETAGGVLSPLANGNSCLDFVKSFETKLAQKHKIDNILIAKNFLGVISSSVSALISFEALQIKSPVSVIFNDINNDKYFLDVVKNIEMFSSKYIREVEVNFFENYIAFLDKICQN